MSAKPRTRKRKKPTFIEKARREQIIEATIETVAAQGLVQTSLAEIAKEADISKGVISYHFDSKDELIEQTLITLWAQENAYTKDLVDAQSTAADKLRTYVSARFEYMEANRNKTLAAWELWGSFDSAEKKRRFSATVYDPCRGYVEKILLQGQSSGEFAPFPANTIASVVQAIIDGVTLQWVFDAEAIDLNACLQEFLRMFDLYTSRGAER